MRVLLMVVVVASSACATAGGVPRPFPRPGGHGAEPPLASRPNGGAGPTGTPLLRTDADYSKSGLPLWLKLDALQPSGSFKLRGVGLLCQHEVAKGAKEIFCASGGNAGIAAAVAGKALGMPVTIVVPETTSAEVRAFRPRRIRAERQE